MPKLYFSSPNVNTSKEFINQLYKIKITPDNLNVIHYIEDLQEPPAAKGFFASLSFYCQAFRKSGILGTIFAFIISIIINTTTNSSMIGLMPPLVVSMTICFSLINFVFFSPLINHKKKMLADSLEEEAWVIINIKPNKLEEVHEITRSKYPTIKLIPV